MSVRWQLTWLLALSTMPPPSHRHTNRDPTPCPAATDPSLPCSNLLECTDRLFFAFGFPVTPFASVTSLRFSDDPITLHVTAAGTCPGGVPVECQLCITDT